MAVVDTVGAAFAVIVLVFDTVAEKDGVGVFVADVVAVAVHNKKRDCNILRYLIQEKVPFSIKEKTINYRTCWGSGNYSSRYVHNNFS